MNILKATKRAITSTGQVNKLRAEGFIPAILYGGKKDNLSLSLKKLHLQDLIRSETFMSKVVDLEIDGSTEKVLPKDVSYDPVSDEPMHIDFMRIVKGSKIILEIPVIFKNNNESPGLKKGGVLNIVRRKVQLKCQAENIPENLVVDLTGLDIGASVKISSVKLPENAKPTITDRDFVVATVAPPTIVKEPEKPAEEAAAEGAEGEEASTGEAAEAAPTKEGDGTAKKEDKGKEQSGDKKNVPDKKNPEKKDKK